MKQKRTKVRARLGRALPRVTGGGYHTSRAEKRTKDRERRELADEIADLDRRTQAAGITDEDFEDIE